MAIRNVNRTVGTLLGHELTKRHRGAGLPDDTISVRFTGSAGQSFGAFVPKGITLRLDGDANDYVGKGLSGGRLVIRPPAGSHPDFVPAAKHIACNVMLYGPPSGHLTARGHGGGPFLLGHSGAPAGAEGT